MNAVTVGSGTGHAPSEEDLKWIVPFCIVSFVCGQKSEELERNFAICFSQYLRISCFFYWGSFPLQSLILGTSKANKRIMDQAIVAMSKSVKVTWKCVERMQ